MVMNGITLLVIFLQAIQVFCSLEELRSLENCGSTPEFTRDQIVGGNIIPPNVYSWIASLEYGNQELYCGGSVISSLYVLTAAHCVQQVDNYGGLKAVRLGNFTQQPFCDYGNSNCTSYLRFKIADIKVHENYGPDRNNIKHNDIALIQVNRPIMFGRHMKRVCLPFNTPEPVVNTQLVVAGWGSTLSRTDTQKAKRAVGVPLLDKSNCTHQDDSLMCAATLSNLIHESKTTCEGDSGGPLMYELHSKQMVIEGIVSFGHHSCVNAYFPTHYTRVRRFLSWIQKKVCTGSECDAIADRKFPTDCGNTPMFPKEQTNGANLIRPDEYSWVGRLVYGNKLGCTCSVINTRYVLTAADCVTGFRIDKYGELTGVQLGDFENGHLCDYGTPNCTHYKRFGIEKIIPHNEYGIDFFFNNIALIRLDRPVQFGLKMRPICLPFGNNIIPEPLVGSSLIVTGWISWKDPMLEAKRDVITTLWNINICKAWPGDETHICAKSVGVHEDGSTLMYYQIASHRMVLEGIFLDGFFHSKNQILPALYTRVRSYGDWLNENMEL